MKLQKKIIISITGFVCLLCLIYVIGIFYYNNRLLPNTYINNINYGGKTIFEIKNNLESGNEEYVLTLIKNDGTTEELKGEDFDYKYSMNNEIEEIKQNQSSVLWLFSIFGDSNYTIKSKAVYDEEKLKDEIKKLSCLSSIAIKDPVNASIEITSDGIEIIKEQKGNRLKLEDTITVILQAVAKGKTEINLEENNCYVLPEITTEHESIKKVVEKVEKATNFTITYTFESEQEVIDSEKIMSWIIYSEDGSITFNEEKIKQYIKNLASKYDTYNRQRQFTTTGGETITLQKGILGWQIDVEKTTEQLIELLNNKENISINPKYKRYCLTRENDDIGNTYIEVSIEKQHLWLYKDGEMIFESDVVTGLSNGKRDTPKGAYYVWSREKGKTIGQYDDEGWEVWVDYWMPFDWTGCGLHDSDRASYGGTVYKTNGSHGCVNCPPATAKFLYENIVTGTPVLIY
jgi:hypothetical protein